MGLINVKEGFNGKVERADGMTANIGIGFFENQTKVKLNKTDSAFFRMNDRSLPAIFLQYDFLCKLDKLLTAIDTSTAFLTKKTKYKVKNSKPDTIAAELASVFDYRSPVVLEMGATIDDEVITANQFEDVKGMGDSGVSEM
ncbi:MAG: hypothetical protein ACRCXT_01610 [Paraclostridium sp.]